MELSDPSAQPRSNALKHLSFRDKECQVCRVVFSSYEDPRENLVGEICFREPGHGNVPFEKGKWRSKEPFSLKGSGLRRVQRNISPTKTSLCDVIYSIRLVDRLVFSISAVRLSFSGV